MERVHREKKQKGFLEGLSRKPAFDRAKADLNMYHQGSFLPPIVRGDSGQDYELEAAIEGDDGETRVVSELPEDLEEAEFKAIVEDFNKAERQSGNSFQPRPPYSQPGRGGPRPPIRRLTPGRGAGPGGGQQRTLVCYYNALHGTCEKGKDCTFSHDPALAREWLKTKMKIYSGSPLLSGGNAAKISDPSLQQRVYPPKRPDALYSMGAAKSSFSQRPSQGGAFDEEEDEDEEDS